MKVYLNKKVRDEETQRVVLSKERQVVEVEVLEETPKHFWVKLPDGEMIKRKKNRDLVNETI